MKLKFGIGIAAVLLSSIALGRVDGYTFKQVYKEGDTLKYKQAGKLDFQGMELDYSAISTRKVVKVDASGTIVFREETSEQKVNGMDIPGDAGGNVATFTMNLKGELLKIEGDKVDESAYRAANLELFIVPDKPVNVNDSWTYDVKEDKKSGAVAAKASFTFLGDDKFGSIDCVKVKYLIKEAGDSGASTEGLLWLRKSDTQMVKMTAKWVNVPITGAGAISGDITETLIQ